MLTLQNISKSYDSLRAVDGVSLTVPPGEIVGLIGPNGSGKSTLLGVISGLLTADSGRIEFDGRDVTPLSTDQRFQAGLVRSFQDPSLFFR
ncbi:MAG: ATP-binding cassette domain-containing protein, partial [Caldilineaceae bacterium]|nr:ATP-binding cassette domain-containing protein [Caldilineaceae bacterium]